MFKSFQKGQQFKGFPALNFQLNNEAYGFIGCTFWLDAAIGVNTNTDNTKFSRWTPIIPSKKLFIQNTASLQFTWRSSNANFNNLPVVTMGVNGSFQAYMDCEAFGLMSRFTFAFVGQTDNTTNTGVIISSNNSLVIKPEGLINYNTGTSSTNAKIVVITNNIIIINGAEVNNSGSLNNWNGTISRIGNASNGNQLDGRIAEVLAFNKALSSDDCIQLSDRLNQKYAIY